MADDIPTGALVVLLPDPDDPIAALASDDPHVTVVWFGAAADVGEDQLEAIAEHLATVARTTEPFDMAVSGTGIIGPDDARVVLLESWDAVAFRADVLADPTAMTAWQSAEQFPNWVCHLTLGYDDGPVARKSDLLPAETVRISAAGLWVAGEHRVFPFRAPADERDEGTTGSVIPPVVDAADLPLCVQFAVANPGARWYAEKMARSLGLENLLPVPWDAVPT